jgi:hypothetical protein
MGLRQLPSIDWTVNRGWVLAANLACDLNAWTRLLGLHDQPDLAHAEPDTLRYRLWHLPARLTRHARRRTLAHQQQLAPGVTRPPPAGSASASCRYPPDQPNRPPPARKEATAQHHPEQGNPAPRSDTRRRPTTPQGTKQAHRVIQPAAATSEESRVVRQTECTQPSFHLVWRRKQRLSSLSVFALSNHGQRRLTGMRSDRWVGDNDGAWSARSRVKTEPGWVVSLSAEVADRCVPTGQVS